MNNSSSYYKSYIPRPIITFEEFLLMGSPMLLCNECQKYIELFKVTFDDDSREEMEK